MRVSSILILCAVGALGAASVGCATIYEPRPIISNPEASEREAQARKYVEDLSRHDFAAAYATLNDEQKVGHTLDEVEKGWLDREDKWGKLIGIEGVRAQKYGKGWTAFVVCRFPSDVHTLSFYYDEAGKVRTRSTSPIAAASMFVDDLGRRHADWADDLSDGRLHEAVPRYKLEQLWSRLEERFGLYESIAYTQSRGLYARVFTIFGHTEATFNVAIDSRGKVTGIVVSGVGEIPPKSSKSRGEPGQPQIDFDRQAGQ
jgi:hypothetical protein